MRDGGRRARSLMLDAASHYHPARAGSLLHSTPTFFIFYNYILTTLIFFPPSALAFRLETLHRIRHRGLYTLETDCADCYNDRRNTCQGKYPPGDFCPVLIILQPAIH